MDCSTAIRFRGAQPESARICVEFVSRGFFFGSSTVLSGYWILLHHGFKLTRYPTNLESRTGIVTSKISTPETKVVRRQVRWITVVFFLSALACSAAISWDAEQKHLTIEKRIRLERHFWLLCDEIEKQGDSVRIYDDSVKELFVNNATDSEILKYLKFSDLEHLSLTKSNVTDAVIDSLYVFPKLRSLDISDTKITVEGLRRLPNGINSLSIARMQISLEELREVLASRSFVKLDLRGIGINDSDLISLIDSGEIYQSGYLSTLVLSDNPITDAGITRLLNGRRRYRFLDLSGTQVDGTGIPAFRVPRRLVLDRTKISDASLPPLLRLGTTLSLKSTSVSISSLSSAEPNVSIALQDCRISEKDLASAGPLQFDTLSLNGKEYTGACFAGSNITAASLDMSHSGLTDACAHYLTKVLGVARLRLSDTSVSDVSLLSVAKLALTELDIRQTAISAKGLLAANFDSKTKVIVGRTQFYYADLERLKQKFDVIVDMDTGW